MLPDSGLARGSQLAALLVFRKVLDVVKDFLIGRNFRVSVNGQFFKENLSEIPKGLVLGPLPLILFINDLPDCLKVLGRLLQIT